MDAEPPVSFLEALDRAMAQEGVSDETRAAVIYRLTHGRGLTGEPKPIRPNGHDKGYW